MRTKEMTKKQRAKADKILRLIKELNDEGVKFYLNSIPTLEIGFLRDHDGIETHEEFFNFLNSDEGYKYYSPNVRLILECYGA